ncbi:MAG: Gfo/Idh/MocA family oxidoreductase [Armatimonadetes bacterium]|nr:Gfo/Idh/MocA family oxidoreductase [Armatimonadota bacterium]
MKTYEFGIVGWGFAGMAHARAIANNPRTHLKAVCTRDPQRLRQAAAEYGVSHTTSDYAQLLAARPDVVVVCTPDHLHTAYAVAALEAGLNVLCEKPLVTDLGEARRLVSLVRETGKTFMTGQCARYFVRSALARAMVDQGDLGRLFFAEADYLHDAEEFMRDWRIDPVAPQNMILGGGCHPVDLLRWLVGNVAEAHAFANKLAFSETNPIEHDCVLMSLKFESGAIGKVLVTVGCKRPYSLGISLYGDRGTLVDERLFLARIPGLHDFMPVPVGHHSHDENPIFEYQLAHLVECLDDGRQPAADVVEGTRTVATCLAAVESVKTGKVVRVYNEF